MDLDKTDAQVALRDDDSKQLLPAGAGLVLIVAASFVFWAAVLWAVL